MTASSQVDATLGSRAEGVGACSWTVVWWWDDTLPLIMPVVYVLLLLRQAESAMLLAMSAVLRETTLIGTVKALQGASATATPWLAGC
jgi:hypothetical protein